MMPPTGQLRRGGRWAGGEVTQKWRRSHEAPTQSANTSSREAAGRKILFPPADLRPPTSCLETDCDTARPFADVLARCRGVQRLSRPPVSELTRRSIFGVWPPDTGLLAPRMSLVALTVTSPSAQNQVNLAPLSRRRPVPSLHAVSSLLGFGFAQTRQHARARLTPLRHETLPGFRHRTRPRIYRIAVSRPFLTLQRKPSIFPRLYSRPHRLLGPSHFDYDEVTLRNIEFKALRGVRNFKMNDDTEPREPGARRRKFAGYLRAANELRQSYQQQYTSGWSRSRNPDGDEYIDETPGAFPDAAIVRSGDEEMIVFPSYSRKHVKTKVDMRMPSVSVSNHLSHEPSPAPFKNPLRTN